MLGDFFFFVNLEFTNVSKYGIIKLVIEMIKYDPFWETLKKRGESTYTLIHKHGISSATIDRIRKEGGITTQKINDLCKILDCRVEDVITYEKDD